MPLPYCIYVLYSHKDHYLYTGFSRNVLKRLDAHNKGQSTSTTYRRPLELIFCEYYVFKKDALKRERYLKTSAGKRAIKLMLRSTLISLNYPPILGIQSLSEENDLQNLED